MKPSRRYLAALSVCLGGVLGGGVLAYAASDASSTPTAAAVQQNDSTDSTADTRNGASSVDQAGRSDETPLTGDELTSATAAAEAAVPGATIDRAETDGDGDTFEVHVTNADGTRSTVKLDANFAVTSIEEGGGHGGHRGGRDHGADDADDMSEDTTATTTG